MASSTTNYNLIKPDYEDDADIKDLNDNFDTIDMAMNNLEEGKQAALTTAQIAAVNSGIDSTKVAQIETNKNNIADIKDGTSINSFGDVETALGSKQNTISDLATIRSGAALGTTAVQPETGKGLSTNDYTTAEKTKLDNLAEIKTVGTGLNLDDNGELTATGGGSGGTTNYNDLSNKPQINGNTLSGNKTSAQLGLASASDIPTTLADLSGDSTHRTVSDTEKAAWNNKSDFSGSYNDLTNKPTIPDELSDLTEDATHRTVTDTEKSTWNSKQTALSSTQLDAVNSGIDSTKVEQIETNKNNILLLQSQANWNTNNGVKNICPYNSGSTSAGEGTVWNNLPIDIAAGTYSVSFSTDSTNSALVLLAADGATELFRKRYSTTTVNDTFTISTDAKYIRLYIGVPKTVSNFMIHSFGDDTFVPYALSNAELTAAIQALQAQLANQ